MGTDPELIDPHGAAYPHGHRGLGCTGRDMGRPPTPGLKHSLAIVCCAAGDWGVAEVLGCY